MMNPWEAAGMGLGSRSIPRDVVTACTQGWDPEWAQPGPPYSLGSYGPLWGPLYAAQRLREVAYPLESAAITGTVLATHVALVAAFPLVLAVGCARGYARYGLERSARDALRRGILYGELLTKDGVIADSASAALVWELLGDIQLASGESARGADCFARAEVLYRDPHVAEYGLVDGQEQDLGDVLELLYGDRYPVHEQFDWPKEAHVERIADKVAASRDGRLADVAVAVFTPRTDERSDWREPFQLAHADGSCWWNASQLFDADTDGSTEQGRIRGRWRVATGRAMGVPTLATVSGSIAGARAVAEGAAMALLGILELQQAGDDVLAEVETAILLGDCRAYLAQVDMGSTATSPVQEVVGDCLAVSGDLDVAREQYSKALGVYEQEAINYSLAESNLMVLDRLAAELLGDDAFAAAERPVISRVEAKRNWCAERI